jgi:hypothetical protein
LPIISNLVFRKTDSTITATWDTDTSSDSNMTVGGLPAIDNGVAPNTTTGHQCVKPSLLPNTVYSCFVTSGGTSSSPQNVTTDPPRNRFAITSGALSVPINPGGPQGDTYRSFVSNDNFSYMTQDDGQGFVFAAPNTAFNIQIGKITNETAFTGTNIDLSNYGARNTLNGTDGPAGAAMTNKSTGLFGINGNLHSFVYRQFPPTYTTNRYCNWIKSTDKGATWNNFTALSTFTAGGNPVTPNSPSEPIQFYVNTIGLVSPVLYGKDDGTLGYNSVGNQIDGGNAYVYCTFLKDNTPLYLMRIPRIQFDAQTTTAFEYWVGPASPAVADFVNDANWSSSPTSATVILTTSQVGAWYQAAFVPAINYYILTTWQGLSPGSKILCYTAPTPAGPWSLTFQSQSFTTTGSIYYGPFPFHRDVLSNTLTDNLSIRLIFQAEPGFANYTPNWSSLILSTTPALATNTFVQGAADTVLGPLTQSMTKAFPSNVTSGSLLAIAWRRGTSGVVDVVSDNMGVGNVWTIVYDTTASGAFGGWAYTFTKGSGACTVTVHQTVSQANGLLAVGEWHGPNAVRFTPAGKLTTGSLTPTSNTSTALDGDLVLGIAMSVSGATATAAGSGYTERETATGGATEFVYLEDNLNASPGPVTAGVTYTGAQTGVMVGVGVFYTTGFAVSGNAGVADALISWTGTSSGSVLTDASGNFSIPNLATGSYTITPSLANYSFLPVNQNVNVINADIAGVNFTATASGGAGAQGDMLTTNRWCTRLWG